MCGIVAVVGHDEASRALRLGLHSLQHRGEEASGIATSDGISIHMLKKRGRVGESMTDGEVDALPGAMGIGHVRYSTVGGPAGTNSQPLYAKLSGGPVAMAHNGQIANAEELRAALERDGSIFQTSTDTEVVLHLMARSRRKDVRAALQDALGHVAGAYSLILLSKDFVLATRDPMGIRPLVLGSAPSRTGRSIVVASESCAIEMLGGRTIGDVSPGEIVLIRKDGKIFRSLQAEPDPRPCVFELIYFARPDSSLDGRSVYSSRVRLGEMLAKEHPVEADICVPVPDSGIEAAIGYSKESGIPFERGILRAHYPGRTFIQPGQTLRQRAIRLKLSPVREILCGKRVVVVDDSIVRSNTSRRIVSMLREVGAKEVHFRVSSPPIAFPCYYGIDTPDTEELIASSLTVEGIRKAIDADSLGYLSRSGMAEALEMDRMCDACFTGAYPVRPQ